MECLIALSRVASKKYHTMMPPIVQCEMDILELVLQEQQMDEERYQQVCLAVCCFSFLPVFLTCFWVGYCACVGQVINPGMYAYVPKPVDRMVQQFCAEFSTGPSFAMPRRIGENRYR